ncbi:TPA: hypothetical protein ACMEXL_004615 [Klebsiella variicola subsp. variicola]
MRKPQQKYDLDIPDDYKMAYVMEGDRTNFESINKWFYLGADFINPRYAKVGITMGNLSSRSYSSANPNYYLFCAFQCDQKTTRTILETIERGALNYLDDQFRSDNGQTKRARHFESQRLSECYYGIEFEDFFGCLHSYLLDNHAQHFQIDGYEDEAGYNCGHSLAMLFNPRLQQDVQSSFRNMVIRA